MALSKIDTPALEADSVGNTILNLSENYAFTGTVSGTPSGYKLLGRSVITSATNVVAFTDIIDSSITNIIVKGSVRYTDGQNSLTYMYLTTSGGSTAGTGGSGLAVYQGSWHNRAAASSLSSAARNGNFQYLRLPDNDNAYGGTVQTFTVEINDINVGRTQGTTNISGTPKHRGGIWYHQGQYVNASDWSGGGGWCKFINANNDLAAITGVRFNPSVSNYQTGEIAVYGLATS